MTEDLKWFIGISVSIFLSFCLLIAGSFRSLSGKIEKNKDLAKEDDAKLHGRVNKVREEYVRRAELNGHLNRIESTLREIRDEQHETSKQIIRMLTSKPDA